MSHDLAIANDPYSDPHRLSQKEISRIVDNHEPVEVRDRATGESWKECAACGDRWPCPVDRLIGHIRSQEREIDDLKADLEETEYGE